MNKLKPNRAYMVRNDGEIFECGSIHPYILYDIEDPTFQNLMNLYIKNPEWNIWFYNYTKQQWVKSKIKECIQYLADILISLGEADFYNLGVLNIEDISHLLDYFDIIPQPIEDPKGCIKTLHAFLKDLNDKYNQEFLKCRTSGRIFIEKDRAKDISFRVGSTDFNWFSIIESILYENRFNFNTVSIMADNQSGKKVPKDFYIIDRNIINMYSIEEFFKLPGNLIIESIGNKSRLLNKGYNLNEVFGDCGPYHNHNKFISYYEAYKRNNFMTMEQYNYWKATGKRL